MLILRKSMIQVNILLKSNNTNKGCKIWLTITQLSFTFWPSNFVHPIYSNGRDRTWKKNTTYTIWSQSHILPILISYIKRWWKGKTNDHTISNAETSHSVLSIFPSSMSTLLQHLRMEFSPHNHNFYVML